jgi:AraC-like DNA-binding protein
MEFTAESGAILTVSNISTQHSRFLESSKPSELTLLWFTSDGNKFKLDNIDFTFNKNDVVCITDFHRVVVEEFHSAKVLRWNKQFYCLLNHDSEVGCKGVLFYGAAQLPVIHLDQTGEKALALVWKVLEFEMTSQDNLQEEMLQMLLKRILILCTRMYKSQSDWKKLDNANVDIIREYHYLVEHHFREKHTVQEYAELLQKSPKTLSNVFKKLGSKTPLQFIKDRHMLEARRLLRYTDKTVSEIAYEIGFTDVQSFSRFFKNYETVSPVEFRATLT